MIEGELLYFTPAEFVVLMELAGEGPYSMMFIRENEIDDDALTQAFVTLFQRDLIYQNGAGFTLSARGKLFQALRQARFAVMISAEDAQTYTAGCYVGEEALWLVECIDAVLDKQFRIRKIEHDGIRQWLLDKGAFVQPILNKENAKELTREFEDELSNPEGHRLLRLERYCNGGNLICAYELLAMDGCNVVTRRGPEDCTAEICTAEAISHMLSECFGKDQHDNCQCKGARS